MAAILFQREVEYPDSDGEPMGESDLHIQEMMDLIVALKQRFRDAADVYVAGDMLLYYVQGDPTACVCPDVFVVRGVPKVDRRSYLLWKEGQAPSLVIEVTSRGSRDKDLRKREIYSRLGVEEYFLHDPAAEYLSPPLQGFRLVEGKYRRMKPAADGSLQSVVTGLTLRQEGARLRLVDSVTGEALPWTEEMADRADRVRQAENDLQEERAARRAAEDEVARLRRELERRE